LASSSVLSSLTTLDLSSNDIGAIGDAGIHALVTSPHLRSLKRLYLRNNPFGLAGARALAEWPQLHGLEVLDLTGCDFGPAAQLPAALSRTVAGK
jgi:hypothetical protein